MAITRRGGRALYPVHRLTPTADGRTWRRHYRRPPRLKRTQKEETPMLDEHRVQAIDDAIASEEAAGRRWTNESIRALVGGN
jgi:hypothetical protein